MQECTPPSSCYKVGVPPMIKQNVSACATSTAKPMYQNFLHIQAWLEEHDPSFEHYDEVIDGVSHGFL